MTDKYLKRANAEYFHGRGLRVRLMKGEALKVFTGKTTSTPELSKKAKFGKGAEAFFTTVRLPIVTPIAAAILDAVKPLPQASTSSSTSSGAANAGAGQAFVERRMAPLQDLIAPVNFDVPPSALPEGYMQKASAYAVQRNLQKSSRGHHREDRRKALAAISRGEMTPGQYAQSLQGTCDYGRRGMKDQRKAIRKARKQERRMLRGKDNGKTERRANMAERRDIRRDDKLVWLVVYPIERGM